MTNRIDRHPVTGERVLITPNRLARPNALLDHPDGSTCPFCPGNESETPPEIERVPRGDGWLVRVVPNKYPAASPDTGIPGIHEVIIESPVHDDEFRRMGTAHLRAILDTWLRRYSIAAREKGVDFVALFRNRGAHAGESIRHPHSQLLAVPYVPERIAAHAVSRIDCQLCRLSSDHTPLVIRRGESFDLVSAPAARFPYQTWVVPRRHLADPASLDGAARDELCACLHLIETILVAELGEISINWYFITPPRRTEQFHWYLEVSPRLTGIAGYELATGSYVNLVSPERSAAVLRRRIDVVSPTLEW